MPQGSKYLIGGYAWQYIVSNSKINRKVGSFGATDSVLVSIMPPRRRPPPTQTAAPNPSAVHSDAPSGQPVLEEERLEEERLVFVLAVRPVPLSGTFRKMAKMLR